MAIRPVYVAKESAPFFDVVNVDFEWNGGFAKVQKQKNIQAIHAAFARRMPDKKVLEISSKSMQKGGEALSAFFLPKFVPELGKSIPVECVFQAGKVFVNGGPYKDLMSVTPREAKRDGRLNTSGRLTHFTFDGKEFPLIPRTIFYDFIYINALFENENLAQIALEYDAFTDVEFNPEKSLNCQAKAAATFVALSRMGLVDKVKDFETFIGLYGVTPSISKTSVKISETKSVTVKPEVKTTTVKPGSVLKHKKYGEGKIEKVEDGIVVIKFESVGMKSLGLKWCEVNCEITPAVD